MLGAGGGCSGQFGGVLRFDFAGMSGLATAKPYGYWDVAKRDADD